MTGITPVTVTFLAQEILPKGQRFLFSGIVVDPVQVEIPFGPAQDIIGKKQDGDDWLGLWLRHGRESTSV